jgi:hypothetical protein
MLLVKENIKNHNNSKSITNRIYINTLTPYFNYKNKEGKIIMPEDCCIKL